VVQNTEIYLPLEEMINASEEKRRLAKEISKVEEELARVQKKLENRDFLTKAKEGVIRKEKEKAEQFVEKIRTLHRSLERIQEFEHAGGNS
jgi:valyl-tRNA synthetase